VSLYGDLFPGPVLDVAEDPSIRRHEIAHRLTSVERRLMTHFAHHRLLITCVGNIGVGKSSLVKLLAYSTGMNALFELPDAGFEDLVVGNESVQPLLATAKDSAKRTLGRYYGAINEFIECQGREPEGSPAWLVAKRNLERGALDIQHAYLDLRRMQLQAVPHLSGSTCVDGSSLADRFAFCEVLHRDMDVPYLTEDALATIDGRLEAEFKPLVAPGLLVLVHGPVDHLLDNIRERHRSEERTDPGAPADLPEGLVRLVRALQARYASFVDILRRTGWYGGPVLRIDVSRIDFVSNVRHLIAVYEGVERLLIPRAPAGSQGGE
jgi:deoxyadenosine/deoxycytidine kinase